MANSKGFSSRSLLNYYSVKKPLVPRPKLKGLQGPCSSARIAKVITTQHSNNNTATSTTKQESDIKLNYQAVDEGDVFLEGISNSAVFNSQIGAHVIQFNGQNFDEGASPSSETSLSEKSPTFAIKETLNIDGKSRKRKISSNSLEVNNANPVKVIKLSIESDTSKLNNSEKQMTLELNKEGDNPHAIQPKMERKKVSISNITSKLMRTENADNLKQLRESKRIIDQAKDKLANLHQQLQSIDTSKKEATVTKTIDNNDLTANEHRQADTKVPAYQRFHAYRTQEAETSLVLPFKYRVLAEIFKNLDSVVSMVYNRHEICFFNKLQPAVQEMQRRTFNLHHLGQIKTIFPTAYHLKQERIHSTTNYQLTVSPNMDCFSTGEITIGKINDLNRCVSESTNSVNVRSCNKNHKNQNCPNKYDPPVEFRTMKPSFMIERRNAFNRSLLDIVKKHHMEFLASLNPPLIVPLEKLIRWHPSFHVDAVPDITPSELPQPEEVQKYTTAKDVLAKVKGLYSARIDNALVQVSSQFEDKVGPAVPLPARLPVVSPLKGIPLSLLEKIRAREAAKITAEMTRDPATELRIKMLSRLPEMARILRNLIISEKKAAVSLSHVMAKILESYVGSITPGELEEHLRLLIKLVPEWVNIVNIRAGSFVKVNKTMNFNNILIKLENAQKSAKT